MTGIDLTIKTRSIADKLAATLPRATEIVRSQRILTAALSELQQLRRDRAMALKDKAAHFAERLKGVPDRIEAGLDALLNEVTAMEADAAETLARGGKVVADARAGIAVVKDIVNQLDNGAPTG